MRTLLVLTAAFGLLSCNADDKTGQESAMTEEQARHLAETRFIEYTHGDVTTYLVNSGQHTSEEWVFVVEGTGEFSGPGSAWMVEIDKTTGHVAIDPGR